MSKKWLVALCLAATLLLSAALADTGTATVNNLNIRKGPDDDTAIVGELDKGDEVDILGKSGHWYKISNGKVVGYVYRDYLNINEDDVDTLKKGDRGSAVRKLQQRLKELGYFDTNVTGTYGSITEEAIKAFQERNKLNVDGIAGKKTQEKLYSSSAKKANGSSASTGTTVGDDSLSKGDRGDDVKQLQQRLKELGYFKGTCTGYYGDATEKAVKAFQSRNGLTADGKAGEKTLKKLESSSAKKADGETAKDEADDGLHKGDRSDDVKQLQQRLKELGYFKGTCTGYYGSATETAVKEFQTRNGLTADGVAGEKTLKKLNSSSAKKANGETAKEEVEDETEDLKKGSSGAEVKKLQQRLDDLGYFDHTVTGYYGDVTVTAVKKFQSRNNIKVDGIAGEKTLDKLYSSSAKAAEGHEVDKDAVVWGNSNDAIKKLQKRLKELGYFNVYATGYYGDTTAAAVEAFQKRNGLSQTGKCNSATLNKIYSDSAKPAKDEETDGSLEYGDQGEAVKKMQQRLKDLGYFNTTCTGYYGGQTESALKKFQGRNGLTANGRANETTLNKLYSSSAKKAESSSSSSSSSSSTLKVGSSGAEVRALQNRLAELGYFDHSVTGYYGDVTEDAVKAFQKRNNLTVNGVVNATTMKKILSSNAIEAEEVKVETERLDWFNGGASRIPRRATFQVKDVRTGLVFNALRQGGTNHLDAEPVSAADTAILLRIYGGSEFSWHRRPMLVMYRGRVYAASIYGEPHGEDTVGSNNYNGQFCLHFYGSRTHGTDVWDDDHKKCEEIALKATW